mmetsp:Transcript_28556/g.90046  ORF Transcript_28556/g.90046 Transcript_28556/m.90046 type:complete len:205 (+) Transcript_28556:728-1342(+)
MSSAQAACDSFARMPSPRTSSGQTSLLAVVMARPTEPRDQATSVQSSTHCPMKLSLPPPRKRRRPGMTDATGMPRPGGGPERSAGVAPGGRPNSAAWRPGLQVSATTMPPAPTTLSATTSASVALAQMALIFTVAAQALAAVETCRARFAMLATTTRALRAQIFSTRPLAFGHVLAAAWITRPVRATDCTELTMSKAQVALRVC